MKNKKVIKNVGIEDSTDVRRFSFSQLSTYMRCPMQWYYRYILGKKIPPSGAMFLGSQWHGTVEHNYIQKMKTRKDIDVSDMRCHFAANYDKSVKETEVNFESKLEVGQLKDMGIELVNIYGNGIAPMVQPIAVEHEFKIEAGKKKMLISGRIDVLDEKGMIRDNKTKGKSPSQGDIDQDLQLTCYSLAYRTVFKKKEKGLALDCVIKTKEPKVVILSTTRTEADHEIVGNIVDGVSAAIDSGAFYPKPDGWHCSEKWCGYWGLCLGKGKKQ